MGKPPRNMIRAPNQGNKIIIARTNPRMNGSSESQRRKKCLSLKGGKKALFEDPAQLL